MEGVRFAMGLLYLHSGTLQFDVGVEIFFAHFSSFFYYPEVYSKLSRDCIWLNNITMLISRLSWNMIKLSVRVAFSFVLYLEFTW